jgi:hypothetical protein
VLHGGAAQTYLVVVGGRSVSSQEFGLAAAGMRVLNPGWSAWPSCLDVFVSSKLMPRVDCPVLVMHVSSSDGAIELSADQR